MRKFYIGIISLAAILVIYLLYSRLGTPTLPDTGERTEFIETVADSNITDFNDQVGRIGDVGVGTVEKAYYEDRNDETQELERVWGFERLLSKSRDILDTEKPYINIYQRNFTCYITADIGNLRVETAVGKTTIKDATFTSNVVVRIVSIGSEGVKESYIYLDDITYLSDKSLLSTVNSVRYISEDARMFGTGLELVYDDVLERLEYLWVFDLESLRVKSSMMDTFSSSKNQTEKPDDTNRQAKTQQPKAPTVASGMTTKQPALTQSEPEQESVEYYKCHFSKNVLIDSPEQLIFARDEIVINDILWSKPSGSEPNEVDTDTREASAGQQNNVVATTEQGPKSAGEAGIDKVAPVQSGESNESPDELQDVVITCDRGFIIALKDSPKIYEKFYQKTADTNDTGDTRPEEFDHVEGRKTFIARKIDYNALTDDVIFTGSSEQKFYTDSLDPTDSNRPALPVTITSQKQVRFLPSSNQAVFEGDCRGFMIKTDPNFQQEYTLLAPKLLIDLLEDTNDRPSELAPGIRHFTADGGLVGLVKLISLKKAGKVQLGGTKLESRRFDYDPGEDLFVATGPGVMIMDNSKISPSTKEAGKFSLNQPCYVVVREFETLKYYNSKKQIVADGGSEGLIIDYFPVVDGEFQYDRQATVVTPHLQADLVETASGQLKLSTLSASGGITYQDKQGKQFDGSTLFYDADKSIVTVQGDERWPCHYNGAPVDAIEWDLKTDKLKFDSVGPAILQLQ
jgi:hypothetical protein